MDGSSARTGGHAEQPALLRQLHEQRKALGSARATASPARGQPVGHAALVGIAGIAAGGLDQTVVEQLLDRAVQRPRSELRGAAGHPADPPA